MTKYLSKIITNYRIIALVLLLLPLSVSAQVKVTGHVTNLKNAPVADVIIKCLGNGKTLAYTSSNAQGQYVLEMKEMPRTEVVLPPTTPATICICGPMSPLLPGLN